jgi:hypothetical protein
MRYFDNNDGTNLLYNEHIMLLYEDKNKRNTVIIDYINEGLKNGCLCIYASVDIDNSKGISLIDIPLIINTLTIIFKNMEKNIPNMSEYIC